MTEFLKKESIEIGYHAATWELAVEEASRLLEAGGKVTSASYAEGMKEIIHEYGGYCCVAPGLAIPHARPEKGALETGVCYLKLDEPVFFPTQEYNPTRVIVAISAASNEDHMDLLKKLASVLQDEKALETLKGFEDPEEVYGFFQKL